MIKVVVKQLKMGGDYVLLQNGLLITHTMQPLCERHNQTCTAMSGSVMYPGWLGKAQHAFSRCWLLRANSLETVFWPLVEITANSPGESGPSSWATQLITGMWPLRKWCKIRHVCMADVISYRITANERGGRKLLRSFQWCYVDSIT